MFDHKRFSDACHWAEIEEVREAIANGWRIVAVNDYPHSIPDCECHGRGHQQLVMALGKTMFRNATLPYDIPYLGNIGEARRFFDAEPADEAKEWSDVFRYKMASNGR